MRTTTIRRIVPYLGILIGIGILWYFSYAPFVWNYQHVPADRVYLGGEEYPIDMLGNLALVREGYSGSWLRYSKYTSIFPIEGYFLKEEYLLIGHLARLFGTDTLFMFHLTRFMGAIAYIATILYILLTVWKKWWQRIAGFFLIMFGSSALLSTPSHMNILGRLAFDALPMYRLTWAAHHYILSGVACLWSLVLLARSINNPRSVKTFFASLVAGFVASITYAPNAVLTVIAFPFVLMLWVLAHRKEKRWFTKAWRISLMLGIFTGIVAIPILFVRYLSTSVWDFTTHPVLERLNPFYVNGWEYILLLGLVYVFACISFVKVIREKSTIGLFFAAWVVAHPLLEFVLSDIAGLNRIRVFLTPYFVIFGVLAVWGIETVISCIRRWTKLTHVSDSVLAGILVLVIVGSGFYSLRASYSRAHVCFCMFPDFGYPKKDLGQVISWLAKNSKEHDIVLSGLQTGLLIPALSGNDVYTSWWFRLTGLPSFDTSWVWVKQFYDGSLTHDAAHDFLVRERIAYVLLSDEERGIRPSGEDLSYPFLSVVDRQGSVVLYKVVY